MAVSSSRLRYGLCGWAVKAPRLTDTRSTCRRLTAEENVAPILELRCKSRFYLPPIVVRPPVLTLETRRR
jgi:hypothetical protein